MQFFKKIPSLIFLTLLGTGINETYSQTSNWPQKSIRVIVPFAPGSFTDTAARVVGSEIAKRTSQTVFIENKGGAGSTLGTDTVAKANPDGYTFLVTDNSLAVSAALYDKLPYQPQKDIVQVSLLADSPAILIGRLNLPQKRLKEIVQYAQQHPNHFTFGSGGIGSSAHMAMEGFLNQNKIMMTHIPFKGIAGAVIDVAAERIDLAIGSIGSTGAYIKDGRLIGIAISSPNRHPQFPNLPTFAESGFPNYQMMYWFGMMAPAGTPIAIIEAMQQEISFAINTTKVQEVFSGAGVRPVATTPANFSKQIKDEIMVWQEVIKRADIKVNLN